MPKLDKYLERTKEGNSEPYSLAQRLGISLEKFLFAVIKCFFPKKKGYEYWHVDWRKYTKYQGKSIDLQLFFKDLLLIDFECKNWRFQQKFYYGIKDAQEQIIARFKDSIAKLKMLVISFLGQLSRPAQRLLEEHNIIVIETDKLVGRKDYRTSLFKELGHKIKDLVSRVQAGGFLDGVVSSYSNQLQLDTLQYSNTDNSTNTLTNYTNTINKQYDIEYSNLVKQPFISSNRTIKRNFDGFG